MEKLIAIKKDLILNMTDSLQECFEEYIKDEDSHEAYCDLQIELGKFAVLKGILQRNFSDSNLESIYNEMKKSILNESTKYCDNYGYEMTEKYLNWLDDCLKI